MQRQLSLNRIIALKMPHDRLAASAEQLERFRREAESVAALHHPNIVQVHDYGVHEGQPFFSMEFVGGGTLAGRIGNTHVPPRPALIWLRRLPERFTPRISRVSSTAISSPPTCWSRPTASPK